MSGILGPIAPLAGRDEIEMKTLVIVRMFLSEPAADIPEDGGPVTKFFLPFNDDFPKRAATLMAEWDGPVLFNDGCILEPGWERQLRAALDRGAYAASPFVRMGDQAVAWPTQALMPQCWMGWGRQLRTWGVFDERFLFGYERLIIRNAGDANCVHVEGTAVRLSNAAARVVGTHTYYYRGIQDSAVISREAAAVEGSA
jgi:hypothetical protein